MSENLQQAITLANTRITSVNLAVADLIRELNMIIRSLIEENARLSAEIAELKKVPEEVKS